MNAELIRDFERAISSRLPSWEAIHYTEESIVFHNRHTRERFTMELPPHVVRLLENNLAINAAAQVVERFHRKFNPETPEPQMQPRRYVEM